MKIGDKVRFHSEVGGGIVKGFPGEKILYWWKMLMDLISRCRYASVW